MEQPDGDRKKIARAGDEPVARSSATWPDLTGIHAFLIEDNSDTRTMVSEVLIHCGAMVTVYQSADQALADLGEFVPTLFICDLSMPGLDGLQFLRRVRAGAILDFDLESAGAADAANGRRRKHQREAILHLAEFRGQLTRDGLA